MYARSVRDRDMKEVRESKRGDVTEEEGSRLSPSQGGLAYGMGCVGDREDEWGGDEV
jgi:hypothetical protein